MFKNLNVKKILYLKNTFWMLPEHLLKLCAGVFMSVFIARELGPEDFGVLNYILAFVAIFIPIVQLGMSTILVRELINNPKKRKELLSTSFYLILITSFFVFLILNVINYSFILDRKINILITIYSSILFFKAFEVIEFDFQSKLNAKYASISKTLALLLSITVKCWLLYKGFGLEYFVYAYTLDFLFLALFLLVTHRLKGKFSFFNSFDKTLIKPLFNSSWPLILSTLSIILYMRLDQLMIKSMLGSVELGLYSSAVRLYEGYISVVFVITVSLLPSIIKIKQESEEKYKYYLTLLFSIVFWLNNFISLVIMFFSTFIIEFLYGLEYKDASSVLGIVFFASSFASVGSVTARYFIVEKMEKKMILRTWVSLSINLLLNFILIPIYGIEGSAFATLIAIFVGNYVIDYFDKQLKPLIKMKNDAIFFNYKFKTK